MTFLHYGFMHQTWAARYNIGSHQVDAERHSLSCSFLMHQAQILNLLPTYKCADFPPESPCPRL